MADSEYKNEHLKRLRELLNDTRARIVVVPRSMEMMRRWESMSDVEKRACPKEQVEYLVISGTNGNSVRGSANSGSQAKHILSGFERPIETPEGARLVHRLRGPMIELMQELVQNKPELAERIETFVANEHPYPLIRAIEPGQLHFAKAKVNGKPVLVMQVQGDKRLEDLRKCFMDFGLWDDALVQSQTIPQAVWSEKIHTLVMDDVSPYLLDVLGRQYPDYFADKDLGAFKSWQGAIHKLIEDPQVSAPEPVVRPDKTARSPKAPTGEPAFEPLSKEELAPMLKGMGVELWAVRSISGNVSAYEVLVKSPSRDSNVTKKAVRSLMHHAIGHSGEISLYPSHGGLAYRVNFNGADQKKAISTIEYLCRKATQITNVGYALDTLRMPDETCEANLHEGILSLSGIPVFKPSDGWELAERGRPAMRKKPEEIGRTTIHVAPIKVGKENKIQILVNAPMGGRKDDDFKRQVKPILRMLRLDDGNLQVSYGRDVFLNYTTVTVTIPHDGVFKNIVKAFGLEAPLAPDVLNSLQMNGKPDWLSKVQVDPDQLVFVDRDAEQSARTQKIKVGRLGRFRGPKKSANGENGGVTSRSIEDHKAEKATDELADSILELVTDDIYDHRVQARMIVQRSGDGTEHYHLCVALTKDERGNLSSKISNSKGKNINKSNLKVTDIEAHGDSPWDTNYLSLAAIHHMPAHIAQKFLDAGVKRMDVESNVNQSVTRDFVRYIQPHVGRLETESKRQQRITVDIIDEFARAMADGKAALGHVEYLSPAEIQRDIADLKELAASVTLLKEQADALAAKRWVSRYKDVVGLGAEIASGESKLERDFDHMVTRPHLLLDVCTAQIKHYEEMAQLIAPYANPENPEEPVRLPIIFAHTDPIVRNKGKDGHGIFPIIEESIRNPKRLHGGDDEKGYIASTWGTRDGMQVLLAENEIRVSRTGKEKSGKEKAQAAWFVVSPELARATQRRAEEMIDDPVMDMKIEDVITLDESVELSSIPFTDTFFAKGAQKKAVAPKPEKLLEGMGHRAVMVYEKQDHGVDKASIDDEHRGAQPVLYLAVTGVREVTKLVRDLDAAGLLAGQKEYITTQDPVLIAARKEFEALPKPRDFAAMDAIDDRVRANLDAIGASSIAWVDEVPKKPEVQYGTQQVHVIGAQENHTISWDGDKAQFNKALNAAFDGERETQLVKIYLNRAVEGSKAIMGWRQDSGETINAHAFTLERHGAARIVESTSKARADGSHRTRVPFEDRVGQERAAHSAQRTGKMESPRDAARKIAQMTADKRAHEPDYIEGIWAAMAGDEVIAQARQEALRAKA